MKAHWEKVYAKNDYNSLGWYEEYPEPSMELIEDCGLEKDSHILIVGAGASTLIDQLLRKAYLNISANDLSINALDQAKQRIGTERSKQLNWIADDLTNPSKLNSLPNVDLWHDRAVLHFFTEAKQQDSYFELMKKLLHQGGHAIIAAFSLTGAEKCSGLPVKRYNVEMLQAKLGPGFELLRNFQFMHSMPNGELRDYIYTLFQRTF